MINATASVIALGVAAGQHPPAATVVQSLLPPIRWLDVVIPPLLLLASLVLHILYNDTPSADRPVNAHLYRAQTSHARFVPSAARHAFSYPVLFLGLDLDQLEHPKRPLDHARWFKYNSSDWSCMAIRSKAYLEPPSERTPGDERTPIKTKLLRHLQQRGIPEEQTQKVYTVTMPAFLGLQDINPLTIHYVYSIDADRIAAEPRPTPSLPRRLHVVVLEVSNTFGEKHLYVLRCGIDEDDKVAAGFEHQWTFPRAFHVSPFNDRTGHYRVSLSDPLAGDASSPISPTSFLPSHSRLNIKIVFLTPSHEKKFFADLSGPGEPLCPSSILSALLRWPLSLLLTTPRILYQAMLLHYRLRLDVFPRPDPYVASATTGETSEVLNPVEEGGRAANIQWQEESAFEARCRTKVLEYLERQVELVNRTEVNKIRVILQPADLAKQSIILPTSSQHPTDQVDELKIDYFSNLFWVDLYVSPTIQLALEVGSKTEKRWKTSDPALFLRLFPPSPSTTSGSSSSRTTRIAQRLRISQMRWSLSFSPYHTTSAIRNQPTSPHPLDSSSFADVRSLWLHFFFVRLGYWLFVLLRARFVRGTEPWEEWARWSERFGPDAKVRNEVKRPEAEFGSVLRLN